MKTSYTIKNFAKRVMMAITIVLFAGNAWGEAASLPIDYSFSSGSGSLPTGVSCETLGSDYTSHPPYLLKFDDTNDYLIVQVDAAAKQIILGVKMIGGNSTSYFQLSGSSDGSSYTNIEKFTISGSQNDILNCTTSVVINSSYRYFKFTFTKGSNVGVGVLKIAKANTTAYTMNFSATSGTPISSSITEESPGAGIELPNVTPNAAVTAAGWGFYGWAEAAVGTETTTAPTIVGKAGDTYYPDANTTLYAVYAKGEYTKVTSTSEFSPSGGKYIVVGYDSNNSKVYAMTHNSYTDDDLEHLAGKQIGTSPAATYSAAEMQYEWRCEITFSSANQFFIRNLSLNDYVDTQAGTSTILTSSKYSNEWYTITYANASDGYCSISNNTSNYGGRYLVVYVGGGFSKHTSAWDKMMFYKETTAPKYVSAPCLNIVTLSAGTETNATISSFSDAGVQTCSSTAADRQVTITVAAATGYEFLSTARLTFAKTSGTATAEYVSGPTGTGPYTWVYQFSKDDSGAGTFSVTSATPKSYTITLNGNDATTDGTANVTATYNSTTLSASITNPKKTHYMFQGWYSGSGGSGDLVINKAGELQANVAGYTGEGGVWTRDEATTLYAKWTEHSYTNYRTKCCDDPALAFDGEYNYQTFVREDIKGARGGNGSATVEQGKATLVLDYTTSSAGTCTAEVKKLTGADKRSTIAAGSDVSNHTGVSVDEEN